MSRTFWEYKSQQETTKQLKPAPTDRLYSRGYEISEQHEREGYTSAIIGHFTKGHTRQTIQH